MSPTRREFLDRVAGGSTLVGVASASATLAGCLSLEFGGDDPPPVDVEPGERARIAAIEPPGLHDELLFEVTEDHLDEHRRRVQTLLDDVPPEPGGIPNEAVRNYVSSSRSDASADLSRASEREGARRTLSSLRNARVDAASAEGAYAAAHGERTREDVFDAAGPVSDRRSATKSNLERIGDTARHAVLVYGDLEERLQAATRHLDRTDRIQPATSEVTAVGEAAKRLESARAELDIVDHVTSRRTGERTFDDAFERTVGKLRTDVEDRIDVLPADRESAGNDLFDRSVEGTPREEIAATIHHLSEWNSIADVDEHVEAGRIARGLLGLFAIDHLVRTTDWLQRRVAEGAFDRPERGQAVRDLKQTAVDSIATALDSANYPRLARLRLLEAERSVSGGDRLIDGTSSRSLAVRAPGRYAVATAQARTVRDSAAWFVENLP